MGRERNVVGSWWSSPIEDSGVLFECPGSVLRAIFFYEQAGIRYEFRVSLLSGQEPGNAVLRGSTLQFDAPVPAGDTLLFELIEKDDENGQG